VPRIGAAESVLVVVDMQDRLLPAMAEPDAVAGRCATLMQAARRLDVPMLVSEQYPKGLGRTVAPLAALMPNDARVEKTHFSCMREPGFAERLGALGRRQVTLCGIETHVCVLQTALDLAGRGYQVSVVADAVGSRKQRDHDAGLRRMEHDDVSVMTTEMVVFEWLERAGTAAFKELSALIK
jgi:nicotinamidase-related amidase